MVEIDIEKLKQWLKIKCEEVDYESPEDSWDWGKRFAFDWVLNILDGNVYYKAMLSDLERNKENENI